MTRFEEYCNRQRQRHGAEFVPPTDTRFIYAYNKGEHYRVKVLTCYGAERFMRWGYVALTTGHKPSFMLMRRRGQHGSSDLLGERENIVASRFID